MKGPWVCIVITRSPSLLVSHTLGLHIRGNVIHRVQKRTGLLTNLLRFCLQRLVVLLGSQAGSDAAQKDWAQAALPVDENENCSRTKYYDI